MHQIINIIPKENLRHRLTSTQHEKTPWGAPARPDYEAMQDDYDLLCEWLHKEVGYDIASEPLLCNAALGMWENEQHPVAILNKLKKEDGI